MNLAKAWFWNVVTSANRLINVTLLFSRKPTTLSKRAAIARDKGKAWGCILCRMLDKLDRGHCDRALLGD